MFDQLSFREKECLIWAALGKTSGDIGAILAISENTVKFHMKNAMRKLHTSSRAAAVIKAVRLGIVELPPDRTIPMDATIAPRPADPA